ncbi:30S ribosomal protein S21 [Sphingobacteriales bacterium UPWRP_1]|nr:30S ribosomal protein S21 [Sphingobacteriales bacterium TSM_CSM]PSJ77019.1 30S ribosomal protein S21 [Sphingobacteriales bacterium UPWRP_1]
MLVIDARESDSIDKALKKYKKKYEKSGVLRQLRNRKYFTKPSIKRRATILKAKYRTQIQAQLED